MTAVIGILNKRGVAIAADSAVTRGRTNESKCTKNGNKMIRLSNVVPICLMMTGNADFLETPWEVIARCYRQKRGLINHPTVESCVNDFFKYISDNQVFWNLALTSQWIKDVLDSIYNEFADEHNEFITAYHIHGNYTTEEVKKFECSIIEICDMLRNKWLNNGVWPQFNDYTQEQFSIYSKSVFDEFFGSISFSILPREIIDKLRSEIELTVMTQLITIKDNNYTQLIFTGYGEDQEFPSLVPVIVNGGFDQKIKYYYSKDKIIEICDDRPVAICPFAQKDVMASVLKGVSENWIKKAHESINDLKDEQLYNYIVFDDKYDNKTRRKISDFIDYVDDEDSCEQFNESFDKMLDKNQKVWEEALENYDLRAMAELAESLIDLTGFQRILTFQQEGVGGPVDVAVISKNDGFTWISRKSWYHHKDVNGQYGKLGV